MSKTTRHTSRLVSHPDGKTAAANFTHTQLELPPLPGLSQGFSAWLAAPRTADFPKHKTPESSGSKNKP